MPYDILVERESEQTVQCSPSVYLVPEPLHLNQLYLNVSCWPKALISDDENCSNPMAAYWPTAELQLLILRIAEFGQKRKSVAYAKSKEPPVIGGSDYYCFLAVVLIGNQ